MRFVIVDDMPPALRFLHRVILQAGHEVVGEADDGRPAVLLCKRLHPDVVVLDNNMPKMPGMLAVEEIQREGSAHNIIFVTTKLPSAAQAKLEQAGCIVIPKSDEDTFLLRAIAKCKPWPHNGAL